MMSATGNLRSPKDFRAPADSIVGRYTLIIGLTISRLLKPKDTAKSARCRPDHDAAMPSHCSHQEAIKTNSPHGRPVEPGERAPAAFSPACAISRFISGMQEPQLVPAFKLRADLGGGARARRDGIADRVAADAEAGADHRAGAGEAVGGFARQQHPPLIVARARPRRTVLTASQSPASRAGPTNRQVSMRSPAKRRRAKHTAAEIAVFGEIARPRPRAARTAIPPDRHCRRTGSRSRRRR